ncbi:alpha-ketoglutarate-dependent dioxygenase alkB isoform X2 [Sesamum indicum]|uniref:Alpha-ketoglutarate-dependent dioxygenase alkB isoform X2 n=1 Tax=Sesamum indicum TaxID=4182 RepID=A0A6I9TZ46_SESIN|nr:alpha-ketoglutarate-dependent dioxygenase alkB isoform X2 [Sesamum indicum]
MYRSDVISEESERTAFRKAEKKYKIYYDNTKKKKIARPVDLSEVVDFKSILERYNCNGELMGGVSVLKCDFDRPIFCLESRPGFYFIPGALSVEEQCQWIRESLTSFPQPPDRTNHNAIYGPIENLFVLAKEGKVLVLEERLPDNVGSESEINAIQSDTSAPKWKFVDELGESHGRDVSKLVLASVLLRKLRWSTLGLQFDWSKRSYNVSLPHKKIPDALCQLAKRMAAPAMPYGEEFQPEAAIVNYFGLGDMLGGHLDDMEKDWSKPIVSMRNIYSSVWVAKLFSCWGESQGNIHQLLCSLGVVMSCLWLGKLGNAFMAFPAYLPMQKMLKYPSSNPGLQEKMIYLT